MRTHSWRYKEHELGLTCYCSKHCRTTNAASTVAPAWLAIFTPEPVNSSWPVGVADCVALDELFNDGEGRIEPEATAAWLVEVAITTPTLDVAAEVRVDASVWPVLSAVLVIVSGEDSVDEADAEVPAGADADEAPADGLNVAVRPQSSAAAPTWSP